MSINATISFNDELHAILRIRADESKQPFATYVQSLLWAAVRGEQAQPTSKQSVTPAAMDSKTTVKHLRDQLKRSKKVSPVKTELVAILTDILKDGADDSEPPAIIPQPVVSDDDDGGIDPYILERAERLRAENAQQGLQPLGSAASPNMIARLARLSKKSEDEMKAMLDSQRKSERKQYDEPEPSDDDWYPDEGD